MSPLRVRPARACRARAALPGVRDAGPAFEGRVLPAPTRSGVARRRDPRLGPARFRACRGRCFRNGFAARWGLDRPLSGDVHAVRRGRDRGGVRGRRLSDHATGPGIPAGRIGDPKGRAVPCRRHRCGPSPASGHGTRCIAVADRVGPASRLGAGPVRVRMAGVVVPSGAVRRRPVGHRAHCVPWNVAAAHENRGRDRRRSRADRRGHRSGVWRA